MSESLSHYQLPELPSVSTKITTQVERDYDRFTRDGLPGSLEEFLLDEYGIDVSTHYAGLPISNPWGKASGQLSMNANQVAEDIEAGLGFVVLKTVIARDETGAQSMEAWRVKESRMQAERITGASGEQGWTISWKGRGWWQTFEEYLQLITDARKLAESSQTLIVPSCKYHLPTPEEDEWKVSEYEYTTWKLYATWSEATNDPDDCVMPLEKDFSPTLAGSDHAGVQTKILEWLRTIPDLIQSVSLCSNQNKRIQLGLKLFNALFDDDFQLEMLRTIHETRPEFFVYGNRLFDPNRTFAGQQGIAFGGPDLSDRNLRVMSRFQHEANEGRISKPLLEWSATGNITTGKMALEYALLGASSFQLHTFFQLPIDQYAMKSGSKTQKALHELYFNPRTGFVIWLHHLAGVASLETSPIRFVDIVGGRNVD